MQKKVQVLAGRICDEAFDMHRATVRIRDYSEAIVNPGIFTMEDE